MGEEGWQEGDGQPTTTLNGEGATGKVAGRGRELAT